MKKKTNTQKFRVKIRETVREESMRTYKKHFKQLNLKQSRELLERVLRNPDNNTFKNIKAYDFQFKLAFKKEIAAIKRSLMPKPLKDNVAPNQNQVIAPLEKIQTLEELYQLIAYLDAENKKLIAKRNMQPVAIIGNKVETKTNRTLINFQYPDSKKGVVYLDKISTYLQIA